MSAEYNWLRTLPPKVWNSDCLQYCLYKLKVNQQQLFILIHWCSRKKFKIRMSDSRNADSGLFTKPSIHSFSKYIMADKEFESSFNLIVPEQAFNCDMSIPCLINRSFFSDKFFLVFYIAYFFFI